MERVLIGAYFAAILICAGFLSVLNIPTPATDNIPVVMRLFPQNQAGNAICVAFVVGLFFGKYGEIISRILKE